MSDERPRSVVHLDTGRDWRGGQAQVLMLMQGLARRGIANTLLAPPGPLLERAAEAGLAAIGWRARGDLDPFALVAAFRHLRRLTPEVVHCHTARAHALGVPAARLAGIPAVVVSRRVAVPTRSGLKYRLPVDRYLCVSRGVESGMRSAGIPADRLAWVPSGVSLEPEAPAPDVRALLDLPPATPLIGTAAALTAEKRHEDLLEAAVRVLAAVPDAHLVWVGEGRRRAFLERRREALGLAGRVHMLGFRHDARGIMAQCTVVALASEMEGIATALIGAQAAGVPVVATAVGGVPEVVRDGRTGRLVPPGAPAALADALIEILTHPETRARMAAEAVQLAREFHIDRTVELTLAEYRAVLARRRGAA